jgi:AcrR family transcriptional regulator
VSPPSARPRTDNRERILQAATRLFAERGYSGTSVQAVAEEVGIRAPSLHYHFASKEQLRDAVLEQLLSGWKNIVPAVLKAATSGPSRFEGVLGVVIDFFAEDPSRARLLAREILDRPWAVRALVEEHLAPWMSLLTEYLDRAIKAGRAHADLDPKAYVTEVVLLVITHFALAPVTLAVGNATVGATDVIDERDWEERRRAELLRICRTALYHTAPERSP